MFRKGWSPMFPRPPTPHVPPYAPASSLFSRGGFLGGAQPFSQHPMPQGLMGQLSQMNQMGQMGQMGQLGQSGGGGLIAKLFGGAKAGGGGINILGMLQNAQKAVGVFQQISPLVQQYGPLVRSLPALISIMRDNDSSDSTESKEEAIDDKIKKPKQKKKNKSHKAKKKVSKNSDVIGQRPLKHTIKSTTNGIPAPKLYI